MHYNVSELFFGPVGSSYVRLANALDHLALLENFEKYICCIPLVYICLILSAIHTCCADHR